MKITVIGAGSHVFGATVLRDAIQRHRLQGATLALVDPNEEAVRLMTALGRRMAADLGVDCSIAAHRDRLDALPGSDFVILSACPEGERRWHMDCAILEQAGLPGQRRECGGLGGLSNALRAISLALDVGLDMERLCPQAVLLAVTNPMPRVVTAVNRFTAVKAYGFCNAALGGPIGSDRSGRYFVCNPVGFDGIAGELGRSSGDLDVVTAGTNHFAWLVSVRDRQTGRDLTADIHRAIRQRTDTDSAVLSAWLDEYGALAMSGVSHQAEYMPPDPRIAYHGHSPYHGAGDAGKDRRERLRAAATGQAEWRALVADGSWEHPVDVAVSWEGGPERRLPMINLPNSGGMDGVPLGRIIEQPAVARPGGVQGIGVGRLPGRAGELCRRVSDVHELVAAGAARGSREDLVAAIEADMAIPDAKGAVAALDRLIAAHRDILPRFHG